MMVEAARKYLGIPWIHRGRSASGVDCSGLIVLCCNDLGIEVEDHNEYSIGDEWERMNDYMGRAFVDVTDGSEEPGDILLFRGMFMTNHCGIRTDIGMIHSWRSVGCVVEHPIDAYWRRFLKRTLRWQH